MPSLRFWGGNFVMVSCTHNNAKCDFNAIFQGILSIECDFRYRCLVNYNLPFNDQNTIVVYTVNNRCIMYPELHTNIYRLYITNMLRTC